MVEIHWFLPVLQHPTALSRSLHIFLLQIRPVCSLLPLLITLFIFPGGEATSDGEECSPPAYQGWKEGAGCGCVRSLLPGAQILAQGLLPSSIELGLEEGWERRLGAKHQLRIKGEEAEVVQNLSSAQWGE